MYKVYINGIPVFLSSARPVSTTDGGFTFADTPEIRIPADAFISIYTGNKKLIRQYIDLLNKNKSVEAVVLYAQELDRLWADFQACFKVLEAAGGYVTNDSGQLLVFYRRGSWDMPKGKIDPGETPPAAAVREVEEETGLRQIELGAFICHTYHTYELKEHKILKKTWWYRMRTGQTDLTPQTEEDIELIRWVDPQTWVGETAELYGSIRDVILLGMKAE